MSTHKKDSLTNSLIAESKEATLEKPQEEVSDKIQFNTNGPQSRLNVEPILDDCNSYSKKSKSADNASQEGLSAEQIWSQLGINLNQVTQAARSQKQMTSGYF